jgi:predicted nucleic acid-binding protein
MIGLDTGFFVLLASGHAEAVHVWGQLIEGDEEACVSCITLLELERLGLKGALPEYAVLCEGIRAVCKLVWIDSADLISSAAKLSHGLGIPVADALILAGLISEGAKTIYTTDKHMQAYRKKAVRIVNLKQGPAR